VDDTFAQLADAVGQRRDMTAERGTGEQRIQALRALIRLADRYFFDHSLWWALDEPTLLTVAGDLYAAIERGCDRLALGEQQSSTCRRRSAS
jgi:hypothetical protein